MNSGAPSARGWLLLCFAASAVGLALTALTQQWWLAWVTLVVLSFLTFLAWLSLAPDSEILHTTKSLLEMQERELEEGRALSVSIERSPSTASDRALRALIDSSIRENPGEKSDELLSSGSGQGARTMRVAKSLRPPSSDEPSTLMPSLDSEVYELLEKLGGGNMGEIWRGRHRRLNRDCAVKILRKKAADWEDEQRFEREARVMAGLSSPHTVEIYDFGLRQDGSFYYVMELLDGIDLQALVERFGPLPAHRVVHILRQACHSLEEAHVAGLVHRDLKPANLILCRYGQDVDMLKVVDFGLAKESSTTEAGAGKKLTRMRTVLGTAAYLAPESRAGSVHVDHRADLYGLGCIAFWLLTGRLVFQEKNPIKMVQAHVGEQAPRVKDHADHVPDELDKLIDRCLSKSPDDRAPDARVLRLELEEINREHYWTDDEARQWWDANRESI